MKQFVVNLVVSGGLFIGLCKLNFLDFESELSALPIFMLLVSFLLLHLSAIVGMLRMKKGDSLSYFLAPLLMYLFIGVSLIELVDKNDYMTFKVGVLTRLFLSFFPIYTLTYYLSRRKGWRVGSAEDICDELIKSATM